MKLKLRYRLNIKPDKNGEYPDALARRLIIAGLAEPYDPKRDQGKKR